MIHSSRFLANKAIDKDHWLETRLLGITATQIAKGKLGDGKPIPDNRYMAFGRDMEGPLSMILKSEFGIMPNEWLICHEDNEWQMATPDGISLDHSEISEIKTTGKDWGSWDKVSPEYKKQVAWQLYVTGANRCLFSWMLRAEDNEGYFYPAWLEPKSVWVERDEDLIESLVAQSKVLFEQKGKQDG